MTGVGPASPVDGRRMESVPALTIAALLAAMAPGSLHGEGDAVNDCLGQPVCCYLPDMTVQISKGSHITPRLLPRLGDNFTACFKRLLNQLIDTGFTACGDADDAFAMAASGNVSVPHNPPKAFRGNEHETEPVIELELQRLWQAIWGDFANGEKTKSGGVEVERFAAISDGQADDYWLVFHASIMRLKAALGSLVVRSLRSSGEVTAVAL
ncbi:hypothetical protein AOC05_07435 [Arthrobacter alpinus]|uniref:Uncharacterized protein n=1 Tax=Arthrobacter alpinus TaxID=656366 RepID=A0A0M4RB75_9MICC|nr:MULTISPECIES: hypothetical protein [Arthrobacter]ALE92206.1 hypothetical protein AOC05_07435 [Arthrobacter alpinus]